jgi:hypothetical protein
VPDIADRYLAVMLLMALALIFTLQGLHIFLHRNMIFLELLLSCIAAISISKFFRDKHERYKKFASVIVVSLSVLHLGLNYQPFDRSDFENKASSCKQVLNIGHKTNTRDLEKKVIGGGSATNFEFPVAPYDLIGLLPKWQEYAETFDCAYVHRTGEAKQFSNWILPQTHSLKARHGNHFFFSK